MDCGQGDVAMLPESEEEEQEEENPAKRQAMERAHQEIDHIHLFTDLQKLKTEAAQKAHVIFA